LIQAIELPVRSTLRLGFRASCATGQQPVFLRVSIGEQSFLDRIDCPDEGGPRPISMPMGSSVILISRPCSVHGRVMGRPVAVTLMPMASWMVPTWAS
jgi:hypothetical protein